MSIATDRLVTVDEFHAMPDPGHPTELVRGKVIAMPPPGRLHGQTCANITVQVSLIAKARKIGRVFGNDTGVVTERGPDTVRGADVSYLSYERVPPGRPSERYGDIAPDLVFEVRSPGDRPGQGDEKVAEYLAAGVLAVAVVDPRAERVSVHRPDGSVETLGPGDGLTVPEVLGDARIGVASFFDYD